MKVVRMLFLFWIGLIGAGCVSNAFGPYDFHVRSSAQGVVTDLEEDKSGAIFIKRSLLCRQAFAVAMTNLSVLTGRDARALRGATICKVDENLTNGLYTIDLDVVWSPAREADSAKVLAVATATDLAAYIPSTSEERLLSNWIGPKQVVDVNGTVHFLGISAMAVGRNIVLSQKNIRMAELDAQAMSVRAFMGEGRKMADVKAAFRPVFRLRCRHPLFPNFEMFVCGYEVMSLEFPSE